MILSGEEAKFSRAVTEPDLTCGGHAASGGNPKQGQSHTRTI